jgi:farnesyl-diphosphate farnesyltransferase
MQAEKQRTQPLKYHLRGHDHAEEESAGATSFWRRVFRPRPRAARLLSALLRDVSRSFYLTLRLLPQPIRPQIGLAYLLARATDTIADTQIVPLDRRLAALNALRERIQGRRTQPLEFGELAGHQASPAERRLLERIEEAIEVLETLREGDRGRIREVLATITSGQELDLKRFADAGPERIVALQTRSGLEDYTYRVAGCVGVFWTRMCKAHLFPVAPMHEAALLRNGVWFGQGLQLVNILRDLPADLRQGRCYLPAEELAQAGLQPQDLLDAANEPRFRPFYDAMLDQAEARLAAGWEYTNGLPWKFARVRLACALPVLIGIRTLAALRRQQVLAADRRVKISRREVWTLLLLAVASYPWKPAWNDLPHAARS